MSRAVQSISVLGGGLEAWFVATRLRAAFPDHRLTITMHPTAGLGDEDAAYAILSPQALEALGRCGVTVADLLGLPSAVPQMGIFYRRGGRDLPLPWGGCGIDWAGTGFHHHWLRARQGGLPHPYFAFSPGYHAMAGNRFAPPDPRNAIGALQHETGLNIAACELSGLLRERLANLVVHSEGPPAHKGPETDLVIDASGGGGGPCSRMESDRVDTPSGCPVHQVEADGAGWLVPLRSGHIQIATQSSALETASPWSGKQLAIGLAAGFPTGCQEWSLPFLSLCLDRLIALLPDGGMHAIETSEYNRLWAQEWSELDAIGALVDGRENERTQTRRALFAKRGFVAPLESDLFEPVDWIHRFLALGIVPDRYDWLSERIDDQRLKQELQALAARIMQVAGEFPDYRAYIAALDHARQRSHEVTE